ncbi:ClpP/crotonase [Pseudovirgaria hyperparasitica]|uniref:ClpP/crotonase n=1 Tax=Pseudovirgaria hyperparasitica TaxID=470096 RepID=A0A6A6W864_9PEZI|nr:ClpP/crotonase [Pseudovirgaria hyperparasitica]KAF2758735.1 ClpP/crotonase [Pseudovirgaria hyperparasitica]
MTYQNLTIERHGQVFVLTLRKAPENRIDSGFAQEIIRALRDIEKELGPGAEGCVITRGSDEKFWCTGLDLDEPDTNPHANTDGFYPLLATLLDYPFPTIALLTGHTFGGACPLALAHDYRIMNASRGLFSMPPVNLGLHFEGIGALPRLKLHPQIARKMLLEAHRWTGKEAVRDGVVDEVVQPGQMLERALEKAREVQGRSKMGVFSLLRGELYGEAAERLRKISYVHGKVVMRASGAKI